MSEAQPRRNIWLILSLCLNVVLIGMIIAGIVRGIARQREAQIGRAFSVESIMAHLPPADAAKVKAVADRHRAKMDALYDASTFTRVEARRLFAAPTFDAAAYAKAQESVRSADDAFQVERMKQVSEIAAVLTADERHSIVDRARQEPMPIGHRN